MSSPAPTTELPFTPTTVFIGRCPPERVGCARIIGPGEYVSLGIALMAWTFHIAMCFFIAWQIAMTKNQTFSSAFYKLYVVLSIVEILHAVPDSFGFRIIQFGLFLDFWEQHLHDMWSKSGYLLLAYFSYFQCFAHVVIAANRYSCFAYPDRYKKWWNTKNFLWATLVLLVAPLPFMSFRFVADSEYFWMGPNQLGNHYLNREVQFWAGVTSACISVSTSIASAVLEVCAVVAFRRLSKYYPISQEQRHDVRLLGCTLLMLVSQAVLTAYHATMMYGSIMGVLAAIVFAQKQISWVFDLFTFNSPFCLFLTSKNVRHGFLCFYGLREGASSPVVDITSSAASRAAQA